MLLKWMGNLKLSWETPQAQVYPLYKLQDEHQEGIHNLEYHTEAAAWIKKEP